MSSGSEEVQSTLQSQNFLCFLLWPARVEPHIKNFHGKHSFWGETHVFHSAHSLLFSLQALFRVCGTHSFMFTARFFYLFFWKTFIILNSYINCFVQKRRKNTRFVKVFTLIRTKTAQKRRIMNTHWINVNPQKRKYAQGSWKSCNNSNIKTICNDKFHKNRVMWKHKKGYFSLPIFTMWTQGWHQGRARGDMDIENIRIKSPSIDDNTMENIGIAKNGIILSIMEPNKKGWHPKNWSVAEHLPNTQW